MKKNMDMQIRNKIRMSFLNSGIVQRKPSRFGMPSKITFKEFDEEIPSLNINFKEKKGLGVQTKVIKIKPHMLDAPLIVEAKGESLSQTQTLTRGSENNPFESTELG